MKFKKVLFTGVISLSLLFTLTSAVVAEEMSGMNMEGQSKVQKSPETQTQPSGKASDHSNMDI